MKELKHSCENCEYLERPLWCDYHQYNLPDYANGHIVTIEQFCPYFKPKVEKWLKKVERFSQKK